MEKVFNKLVRDNIPYIISSNGEESVTRVLEDEEYKKKLYKKLLEEANEVVSSKIKISKKWLFLMQNSGGISKVITPPNNKKYYVIWQK